MKIVIVNGRQSADFIIKVFKKSKHEIICINNNFDDCQYISRENGIDVYNGDAAKDFVLAENNIYDANLFIALSSNDTDNFVACMLAKKVFKVQKVICRVVNPKNVDVFKKLGIDIVISSTYLLGEAVKNLVSVSNLVKSLAIEDEKIVISEILLKHSDYVVNKQLKEISFPKDGSISCVYRNPNVIIPKGDTRLLSGDKLIVISTPKAQIEVLNFIEHGIEK